jgi:hypothetical protein
MESFIDTRSAAPEFRDSPTEPRTLRPIVVARRRSAVSKQILHIAISIWQYAIDVKRYRDTIE